MPFGSVLLQVRADLKRTLVFEVINTIKYKIWALLGIKIDIALCFFMQDLVVYEKSTTALKYSQNTNLYKPYKNVNML